METMHAAGRRSLPPVPRAAAEVADQSTERLHLPDLEPAEAPRVAARPPGAPVAAQPMAQDAAVDHDAHDRHDGHDEDEAAASAPDDALVPRRTVVPEDVVDDGDAVREPADEGPTAGEPAVGAASADPPAVEPPLAVAGPAEPGDPAEPADPAQPADPAEPADPADPVELAEPAAGPAGGYGRDAGPQPVTPAAVAASAGSVDEAERTIDPDDPAQYFVARLRAAATDFAEAAGAASAVVREAIPPARHRRSRCRMVLRYADGGEADLTFVGAVGRPGTPAWEGFDEQIQRWLGNGQRREPAWLVEDDEAVNGVAVDVPAWLAAV
ncbi:hypothetical protein OF117_03425 [Geodermatophilus sp. YIM 151500]|uniref:hypothetical protein n=1 Tax=Geodermatophilus sp. YIM 151500 TaxID=2984531 RepID=UPI0021E469B7|nr:hypothetical protein [Geodermatophilus sp. YIM 151500]MCV2488402.1 hypothetical protein [Geodermatophilus sp. YIM 151500]